VKPVDIADLERKTGRSYRSGSIDPAIIDCEPISAALHARAHIAVTRTRVVKSHL